MLSVKYSTKLLGVAVDFNSSLGICWKNVKSRGWAYRSTQSLRRAVIPAGILQFISVSVPWRTIRSAPFSSIADLRNSWDTRTINPMTRPTGLTRESPPNTTKARLLEAGLELILARGYADTGIQDLLNATGVPRGSFYHHFENKEDFALQVIDRYMAGVHDALDAALSDETSPPVERIRGFFLSVRESYASEGYRGCLLGALGQELSGVSRIFRLKIESCLSTIALRIAGCLDEARSCGDLAPDTDTRVLANTIVNCWEGAALRSRLLRDPAPLAAALDFCFSAVPLAARRW